MIFNLIIISTIALFIYNYILPYLIVKFNNDQNLKIKYNCKWAIVTGGSSGIGKSLCERLISQGISLIIASNVETEFIKQLKLKYGGSTSEIKVKSIILDFRKKESCRNLIEFIENDKEIDKKSLKLLFNNAGYLTMEGYNQTSASDKLDLVQCNSLTSIELTDYFYKHLVQLKNNQSKHNGAIIFTTSSSGLCPTPYTTVYASSKAFLTCFANTLAIESHYYGIDILAVRPGFVRTNILSNVKNEHSILSFLSFIGQEPSEVVDFMFRGLGNKLGYVNFNSGIFAIIADLFCSILGINIMIGFGKFCSNYLVKDYNCYKTTTPATSNNNNKHKNKSK